MGSLVDDKIPDSYKGNLKLVISDIVGSVNQFNVVSDLLVGDQASIMNKLRDCLLKWKSQSKIATSEDRLKLDRTIDVENLTAGLVEIAEPLSREVIVQYQQLQNQNETLLKTSLLPLLQKYIAKSV